MKNEALAGWKAFLASPDAPATAMPVLELEGYLTGLVVIPDLISPSIWITGLWGDEEPIFDSTEQMQAVLGSVMDHYNAVIRLIDTKGSRWKPLFFAPDGNVDIEQCSLWVSGFWKALLLAPDGWMVLARDTRTQSLLEPFAAFIDLDDGVGPPLPDDIDEIRRSCGEDIPHVLPAMRKFAQIRAEEDDDMPQPSRKVGRNEPCPCGSGKKYKRCCGLN
jgi:uncharacterized protein